MIFNTYIEVIEQSTRYRKKGLTFVTPSGDRFVSYHDLHANALRVLGGLQRATNKQCTELVFQVEDNETFVTTFIACLLGKIIPIPLATGPENDCRTKVEVVWKQLSAPYLLIDEKNLERLTQYCSQAGDARFQEHIQSRLVHENILREAGEEGMPATVTPEDIAFVQYSSGSTGSPNGSLVTHKNLLTNISDMIERAAITENDSSISWLPLTHDFGLICALLTNMAAGINQLIIHPLYFVRRPLLWLDKANEYRSTLTYTPNFGLQYIVNSIGTKEHGWDLSNFRLIYNGAEPIINAITIQFLRTLAKYGLKNNVMYPVYGMAEATVAISFPRMSDAYQTFTLDRTRLNIGDKIAPADTANDAGTVTFTRVGYPLQHCSVRICGDDDQPFEYGYIGNIQVKGNNVVSGYYLNPASRTALYTADGWLKTGDIGFMVDGSVVITGRKKNIIIINGQNYYPQDIETVLKDVAGTAYGDIAACAIPDKKGADELVLFVIFKGTEAEFEELGKVVQQKVFKSFGLMVSKIIPVRKFPKTTSGKVQYFKLRDSYLQQLELEKTL